MCSCRFNAAFHMRSFDKNMLCKLFEHFKPIEIKEIGPIQRSNNRLFLTFYRTCVEPPPPETAICPQCGYQPKGEFRDPEDNKSPIRLSLSTLAVFKPLVKLIPHLKRRKRWFLAVYQKRDR